MKKLRWGILSTAKIGVDKVIPAMQRGDRCEVVAIASRDAAKAQQAAASLSIPRAYGSYESLLADAEVDAIYNPLPNHLHVEWSIKALQAGKHVLCEKPIALSSADGSRLAEAGREHPKLKLMEAFMYRHHPQWQHAKRTVEEGRLGVIKTIHSFFSYFNDDPANIRNQAEIGGGALMDIGCYNISLSRFLLGKQPQRVLGRIERDPKFQTDRLASAILDFGEVTSTFTCGTQLVPYQRVHIFGTTGRLEIEIPFNAPPDQACRSWLQTPDGIEQVDFPVCDQYTIQGDLFAAAVLDDLAVPTPFEDAIDNMRVIEAVLDSGRLDAWVPLT